MAVDLPTRFCDARDHAVAGHFAEAETREFEFSQESARTASDLAAVAQADWGGIAGHFVECNLSVLALFLALIHIEDNFFQTLPLFPLEIDGSFTSFLFCN